MSSSLWGCLVGIQDAPKLMTVLSLSKGSKELGILSLRLVYFNEAFHKLQEFPLYELCI